MRTILASASPRRRELLVHTGLSFEVIPSDVEEEISGTSPSEIVMQLATQKAFDVFNKCNEDAVTVIGADTIVVYRDEILGKPADEQEALDMLAMLCDRTHQVYTGVCLVTGPQHAPLKRIFYEKTDVSFYPVDREDLIRYVKSGDPLDKAGAYGIQGDFSIHVKEIRGEYSNVVGLPIGRLYQELKTFSL